MDRKEARRMGRFSQLAIAASKMAVEDAGIQIGENVAAERVGVWIGSGIGGLGEFEEQHKRVFRKRSKKSKSFYDSNVYTRYGCRKSFD